ncbi:MAG: hypothetical protein ABFD75_16300 [Smithella sp.]
MATSNTKVNFVARAVIYNVLTIDIELPFSLNQFIFNEYPDKVALAYHLGGEEEPAHWDPTYPKWYVFIEFPFSVMKRDDRFPVEFFVTEATATKILSELLTVLQLYSPTPFGGRIHAIRPLSNKTFTNDDVVSFPKDIGAHPADPEVFFIANDNISDIGQHFKSLWRQDWRPIHLAVSRYMNSYTRDIFAEGFEPDDAFMDLMISLENIFGSPEAVVYKIAMRAACLLEATAEGRRDLNKSIKYWYKKRSKIAHGDGNRVVEWKDVEALRDIVRQAIMRVWEIKLKGDKLDDYLFLGDRYQRIGTI